ncbi:MAG TPA: porin family protein [Saprospiraceae bacterium]|nr:porin family protein [Saprospiraceae bacterium]HRG21395.1 porin family protein [Saprospiraceae bacterium]HRG66093.1 porin family protein [Saprospiraceae bacterium]
MLRDFKLFAVGLFLMVISEGLSQNFYGSMVLGVNASQIDGDNAAGFNKPGLTGGFKIDYPISASLDISAELLYSSRGSRDNRENIKIDLNYIEMPLIVSFRDWYVEKGDYDKVRVDGGFSYGYLFSAESNENSLGPFVNELKKHDVSFVTGVAYMFTPKWGVNLRYTRSLFKMLSGADFEQGGLLGYFVTLRGEYHF